jgi:hypothetical protein
MIWSDERSKTDIKDLDPSEIEAFLAADRAARPWVYPERLP